MRSELRKDIVSGDWILIAPGRSLRPNQFVKAVKTKFKRVPVKDCVFENPTEAGGGELIASYPQGKDWLLQVVPNKHPAVSQPPKDLKPIVYHGPYSKLDGIGHHELIITRNHDAGFSKLPKKSAELVFKSFIDRYNQLSRDKNVFYVAIFQNWGASSGASIYHPHYQLITLPVVPPDVSHSLRGSKSYLEKNGRCVHCDMIRWEKKDKKRIVFENDHAIVFAPFVSRSPFELRIFPKRHFPYFENTPDSVISGVVDALQVSLRKIHNSVSDHHNFFIHTAPVKNKAAHNHYHWHLEILPKVSQYAGFELETGIVINSVDPDEAAKIIRKAKL